MYIPQIKDRYALVDLARYGTRARKHVHSDVLIGFHPPVSIFKPGDILDANATFNLIQSTYDQGKVYKTLQTNINELAQCVDNNVEELHSEQQQIKASVSNLEDKHDQDIQEMRQYVTQEIDKATAKVVYDELEENLIIYNVKHG